MRFVLSRKFDMKRIPRINTHSCLFSLRVCLRMEESKLVSADRIDEPRREFRRILIAEAGVRAFHFKWDDCTLANKDRVFIQRKIARNLRRTFQDLPIVKKIAPLPGRQGDRARKL